MARGSGGRGRLICTGETYKNVVKMTFAKGAALKDPSRPSTPVSRGTRGVRSTSARQKINEKALKTLVQAP